MKKKQKMIKHRQSNDLPPQNPTKNKRKICFDKQIILLKKVNQI